MFNLMDAVGRGHAPVRNDFSPNALFSIAWMNSCEDLTRDLPAPLSSLLP